MTTCVAGLSSQKLWVFLGLISLALWLVPLARAIVSLGVKGDEDGKYKKKRRMCGRQSVVRVTRLATYFALSLFLLWDPWALSWLDISRGSIAPRSPELDCAAVREMERGDQVGQGLYASVTEARLPDRKVAVKMPNPREAIYLGGSRREFIRESFIEERRLLRQVRSTPNVVEYLGFCEEAVFLELLPTPLETYIASQNASLPFERVAELWMDVASALVSLHRAHDGPIIHTDIRPEQFLFNEQNVLKLGDLNRAHQLSKGLRGFCRSAVSGRFKSPEQLRGGLLTEKTDVYAMGLTFFYILTRSVPFHNEDPRKLGWLVLAGKRPQIPADAPEPLQAILKSTWDGTPELRPSAAETMAKLQEYLKETRT